MSSRIEVIGSLNPEKECQDRVRVLSVHGICQSLRATDYKDPPKILAWGGVIQKEKPQNRNLTEKMEIKHEQNKDTY